MCSVDGDAIKWFKFGNISNGISQMECLLIYVTNTIFIDNSY